MPGLRAGTLRHLFLIERRSTWQDSVGGQLETWTAIGQSYGSVEPSAGRELFAAQQLFPDATHVVTMRYFAGLSVVHRIVLDGRNLDILSINDEEERHSIQTLICREGMSAG